MKNKKQKKYYREYMDKYYQKNKDDPEFKKKKRDNAHARHIRLKDDFKFREDNIRRAREWRLKNRERFNDLIRPKAKAWQKKNYWECRKKNLCYICRIKTDGKFAACEKCRMKKRKHKV